MSAPRLLLLDIETSPFLAAGWSLFPKFISPDHIVQEGDILCWSAKWYGEKEVFFGYSEEPDMLDRIHALLCEADAAVHYNGNKFDIPVLNREFLLAKLPPPPPRKDIDLYQKMRKFAFASKKMGYITKRLGLGGKIKTEGMDLWFGCMNNDPKAWKKMKRYNIRDTRLLEPLLKILARWSPNLINPSLFFDTDAPMCTNPTCCATGSNLVRTHLSRNAPTRVYERWLCKKCGKTMSSRLAIKGKASYLKG